MQHWLVKQEPESYPWTQLLKDKRTSWDGVRNFAARTHLKAMKVGDVVFYYESGDAKSVVGIAEVSKEAYPDPTADEDGWVSVELKAVKSLPRPVTLAEVKADSSLKDMALVRISRLSVQPVKKSEFDRIVAMSEKK